MLACLAACSAIIALTSLCLPTMALAVLVVLAPKAGAAATAIKFAAHPVMPGTSDASGHGKSVLWFGKETTATDGAVADAGRLGFDHRAVDAAHACCSCLSFSAAALAD